MFFVLFKILFVGAPSIKLFSFDYLHRVILLIFLTLTLYHNDAFMLVGGCVAGTRT